MGEPLFDGLSAAIVALSCSAIIVLRWDSAEAATSARFRRLNFGGHLLLGIAVSLLLYRWVDAVTVLPVESRPNVWRGGALAVACGIGLVAAVKAVIGLSIVSRVQHFFIAAGCGVIALFIAASWMWSLLLLTLLAVGIALTLGLRTRAEWDTVPDAEEREPVLVVFASAAVLLLLLGTWQHVLDNEVQRKTRSPRYSAWPKATALKDAWERTDWIAKPEDVASAQHVASTALREQRVALGLGALLVIVAAVSWRRTNHEAANSETHHAS